MAHKAKRKRKPKKLPVEILGTGQARRSADAIKKAREKRRRYLENL